MNRARHRKTLRIFFGIVALIFVVGALLATWDESRGRALPQASVLALAGLLVVGSLVGGGMSWYALFGPGAPRRLISDFYLAQLGKYVPGGGIWQAAGQVGLSAGPELSATRVTSNLAVHAAIQLSAALSLGGFVVFVTDLPGWLRLACGLGLVAPLLIQRSWMASLLRWSGTRLGLNRDDTVPPSQPIIVRSWLWSLLPIVGFGAAYGLLIHSLEPAVDVWRGAVSFAMAWAVGFALLPFPAGLGAREAALVVLVSGPTAIVVAASLGLRLLAIVGDVLLMTVTRRLRS